MKELTINAENETITLTPDADLLDAQADSEKIENILTAGRSSGHIHVTLYEDGTYTSEAVVLDGQHRDGRAESRIKEAIAESLDRSERSSEKQHQDAIDSFKDALR